MELAGKKILVIGGSGTLGKQITNLLLNSGSSVYSVARNLQSAEKIPGAVELRLFADLENSESISTLANYIIQNHHIDGIFVASGVVGFGEIANTENLDAQKLIQVNHLGPVQLITSLLPKLLQSPSSFVASITGVVAEKSFPGMAAYCASKTAHSAWLSGLRVENKKSSLNVFEFRPGHTETGLAGRAIFGTAPNFPIGMDPEYVARKMIAAISNDQEILASSEFQS